MPKIGFACKFSELKNSSIVAVDNYNFKTTTISWLAKQSQSQAEQKLHDLAVTNCKNLANIIEFISNLPEHLRCFRIGSDLLPSYTHEDWRAFWQSATMQNLIATLLEPIGNQARTAGIKLSMHPGQFCCIVSDNSQVVDRSLEDLEYHADVMRWLGYGLSKLDAKINIHLSGRMGIDAFEAAWRMMSPELRNMLTLENDEFQTEIQDLLPLKSKVGLVFDVHHHWIHSGEYLESTDPIFDQIIESWQGQTPTLHYSVSREDLLVNHDPNIKPNLSECLKFTNRSKLRAHSDYFWNNAMNDYMTEFLPKFDIMCESKAKNLASFSLAKKIS